jgi:protein CpxP
MDYFDKSRVLTAAIAILVLLNLFTLAFLWLSKPPHPAGPRGDAPAEYLIETVGLTPGQKQAYRELIAEHQAAMRSTHDSIRYHKTQLFNNLQVEDSINAEVEAAAIGRFQRDIEMNTYAHFSKVRALCSPVQVVKFDKVIGDVLHMMAPPGPPEKR